jgi:MFS-type transporter involved in bile tolerance (Atg22 family)
VAGDHPVLHDALFRHQLDPKLSIEAGLSPKDGIYAGAIYNIGAFFGTSTVGLVAMRFDLRRVICVYMMLAAAALMVFGTVQMPLA